MIKNIGKATWNLWVIGAGAGWLYVSAQANAPHPFTPVDPWILAGIGFTCIGYGVWNIGKMFRNRNTNS